MGAGVIVIELRTLGTLDLHSADGRELHSLLAQPKRVALLAYLCIAQPRGFHRRDTLLGLFWPDSDQEHARTSLRKSLHILRRAIGDNAILSRGDEEVAVDFHLVSCDAAAFEASVKANRLEEALELYRGDLLAGFFIDEAPEFEQWLHSERARLRSCAAKAAFAAAEQAEAKGDVPAAVTWARRSLDLADTDERALRKLLELQIRSGDRAGAIESYETFARRLAAEYETQPSSETRSLIERIRSAKESLSRETEGRALGGTNFTDGPASTSSAGSVAPGEEKEKGDSPRARRMRYAVIALAVLISGTAIWGLTRPTPSKPVVRYTLVMDSTEAMEPATPWSGRVAISPDGLRLAYISHSGGHLLIRPFNQLHATAVPGTEGASTPFFSPDGKRVGFLREKHVQIAPLGGNPPITINDSLTGVAGASWGPGGFIYADGFHATRLVRVEARQGAVPKWFTVLDTANGEIDHTWPDVLPNGKGVLFTVTFNGKNTPSGKSSFAIAVADIPSGKHRVIVGDAAYPRYVRSGHMLYVSTNRQLTMVPFDQNAMKVTGEPTVLVEGMRLGAYGATDLAVSSTGTLVYSIGADQSKQELVWRTRDGKTQPVDSDWQGFFLEPALSPDGKRLAIVKSPDGRTADIWIKQLDKGTAVRLTHEGVFTRTPTWTPDGLSVTFSSNTPAGSCDLWTQRADGSVAPQLQFHEKRNLFGPHWSPDTKWLIFETGSASPGAGDVVGIRPGIDTALVPLLATKFEESLSTLSPDGHWLAYNSNETGRFEVYVVPFPNTTAAKWAISSGGGINPMWSHRGNELFYRGASGDIFAAGIRTAPTFSSGTPKRLFAAPFESFGYTGYAVSADDQRFLMIRNLADDSPDKLIVVENWFEELKGAGARHATPR
jgi:DNA-binding SARP family transcriptional activator